jgi:parvulin-like peptidyl-prolyl isomerase
MDRAIRISHIVLSTREVADAVYDTLKSIDEREFLLKMFAKLARKYSACGSRNKGGDLGFLDYNTLAPELEQAAKVAPAGIVQPPVQSKFGYHVYLITEEQALGDTGVDGLAATSIR